MKNKMLLLAAFASSAACAAPPYIPVVPAATVAAAVPKPPPSIVMVVDAVGTVVGPLDHEAVVLNVKGVVTLVPLQNNYNAAAQPSASTLRFSETGNAFATTDCSGPPMISQVANGYRPSAVHRHPSGLILYVAQDVYATVQYSQSSFQTDRFGYSTGVCKLTTNPGSYFPVETYINLDQSYVEPLHLELR